MRDSERVGMESTGREVCRQQLMGDGNKLQYFIDRAATFCPTPAMDLGFVFVCVR